MISDNDVKEFAIKEGFDKIKYVGVFKGDKVYKPLHNKTRFIGFPFYILVSPQGEMKLVTGELGLKILLEFNKK